MSEVEVTVRMPREVFDAAVGRMRAWGDSLVTQRERAASYFDEGFPFEAASCLFRASMLEHTPPWEPTEAQVTAYLQARDLSAVCKDSGRFDLIAAHAVLCEGEG